MAAHRDIQASRHRAGIRDLEPHQPLIATSQGHGEVGAVRSVRKHVVHQRINNIHEVSRVHGHRCHLRMDVDGEVAALVSRQRGPESDPVAHHARSVTRPSHRAADRTPCILDNGIDRALEVGNVAAETICELGLGDCLRVQPQRGDRSPQPMRHVGHCLPFGGQQLTYSVGQSVERSGQLDRLNGSARHC